MRERLKGSERLAAGVLVCLLLAACATLTTMKFVRGGDRGIRFPHPRHAEEGLDCTDCHAIEGARAAMPNHDICGICHEIDEESADKKACEQCHTRPDQQVLPRKQRLREEVLFSHEPHVAREVDCATCHPAPDKDLLPKGAVKKFCMDCHEKYDAALNECVVCHQEIRKDKVPLWRGGARISHDVPAVWEKRTDRNTATIRLIARYAMMTSPSVTPATRPRPPAITPLPGAESLTGCAPAGTANAAPPATRKTRAGNATGTRNPFRIAAAGDIPSIITAPIAIIRHRTRGASHVISASNTRRQNPRRIPSEFIRADAGFVIPAAIHSAPRTRSTAQPPARRAIDRCIAKAPLCIDAVFGVAAETTLSNSGKAEACTPEL